MYKSTKKKKKKSLVHYNYYSWFKNFLILVLALQNNKMSFDKNQLIALGLAHVENQHYIQCRGDLAGGLDKSFWHYVIFKTPECINTTDVFFSLAKADSDKLDNLDEFQKKFAPIFIGVMPVFKELYQKTATSWTNPSAACMLVLFTRVIIKLVECCKIALEDNPTNPVVPQTFTFVNSCCDQECCSKNVFVGCVLAAIDKVYMTKSSQQNVPKTG